MARLIKLVVNPIYGAWSPDEPLYGTEEMVRETARVLKKRGNEVLVYHNGKHGTFDSVYYIDHKNFTSDCDVLLLFKTPELLDNDLRAGKVYYWTHEEDVKQKLTTERLKRLDGIIAISEYMKKTFCKSLPKVSVIPLGIYPGRYRNAVKTPKLCLYASSPERGLATLLKSWEEIYRQIPEAKLVVTYTPLVGDYPNVDFVGTLPENEMDDLYRKASVWLYPCEGTEMFCLVAVKCQQAGVIPVVIPYMALQETVKFGIKTTKEKFTEEAIKLLKDESKQQQIRDEMMEYPFTTWDEVVSKVEKLWQTTI